jgi:nickel/cobalt transporter (NicO) family protein
MPVNRRTILLSSLALLAIALGIAATMAPDALADYWSGTLLKIQETQRDLHRQLAGAMRAVDDERETATVSLIVLSFLYGVFHAVGPGHGKIVISTYLLTQESQLQRGLVLSLVGSLCQGLTAVVAVFGTIGLLSLPMREVKGAAADLEMMSYGLVALVGIGLISGRGRRLWRRCRPTSPRRDHDPGPQGPAAYEHGGAMDHSSCGHNHGPSTHQLDTPISWKGLAGIVASVGVRPCSGAVLVLLVAISMDLRWAGIGAVFAMSLGTALTVSLLAAIAVFARTASLRLAAYLPESGSRVAIAVDVVGLLGGAVIATFGALLFQMSWAVPVHPLQ